MFSWCLRNRESVLVYVNLSGSRPLLLFSLNKSCMTYTFPINSVPLLKRKSLFFLAISKSWLIEAIKKSLYVHVTE